MAVPVHGFRLISMVFALFLGSACPWFSGPEIAGFLSFRRDYPYDAAAFRSSAYVTTIAVAPAFRGRGVANALYEAIEDYVRQAEPNGIVSVRSWSSNSSHLRLLESRGYETRLQLSEDRGPGVDTVIVAKAV